MNRKSLKDLEVKSSTRVMELFLYALPKIKVLFFFNFCSVKFGFQNASDSQSALQFSLTDLWLWKGKYGRGTPPFVAICLCHNLVTRYLFWQINQGHCVLHEYFTVHIASYFSLLGRVSHPESTYHHSLWNVPFPGYIPDNVQAYKKNGTSWKCLKFFISGI